MEIKIKILVEE